MDLLVLLTLGFGILAVESFVAGMKLSAAALSLPFNAGLWQQSVRRMNWAKRFAVLAAFAFAVRAWESFCDSNSSTALAYFLFLLATFAMSFGTGRLIVKLLGGEPRWPSYLVSGVVFVWAGVICLVGSVLPAGLIYGVPLLFQAIVGLSGLWFGFRPFVQALRSRRARADLQRVASSGGGK